LAQEHFAFPARGTAMRDDYHFRRNCLLWLSRM
jgi:hypothetical protein